MDIAKKYFFTPSLYITATPRSTETKGKKNKPLKKIRSSAKVESDETGQR
jgi:hypothetical protein